MFGIVINAKIASQYAMHKYSWKVSVLSKPDYAEIPTLRNQQILNMILQPHYNTMSISFDILSCISSKRDNENLFT